MRLALLLLAILPAAALPATASAEAAPKLPSGQPVSLVEVIWPQPGAEEAVARFRFLAPKLRKGEGNEPDLAALCDRVALPAVLKQEVKVDQIIVSLAAKPVKFGEPHPEVVQVIEAYVVEAGHCAPAGLGE